MKINKAAGAFLAVCLLTILWIVPVNAQIDGVDAFDYAVWEKIIEVPRTGTHYMQSICTTDDYIICLENSGDKSTENDTVRAFYLNKTDSAGNPVEQYSEAFSVTDHNYEHCNGMAYNPKTQQIAVALYTNVVDTANRGCIMLMDANSLEYVGTVKISDDWNLLGIDYDEDNDRYIIQTNVDGGYSFKILDSDFNIIDDLGEYDGTAKGSNFQDLCVDGDCIINFPLTLGWGIGDWLNVYSISEKQLEYDSQLEFPFENVVLDEPEGITEPEPGLFMVGVDVTYGDGTTAYQVYKTMVPYNLPVEDVKVVDLGEEETANADTSESAQTAAVEETSEGTETAVQTNEATQTDASVQTDESTQTDASVQTDTAKNEDQTTTSSKSGTGKSLLKMISRFSTVLLAVLIVLLIAFLGFLLLTLRVRRIRAERDRKRAEARRHRERLRAREAEIEEESYEETLRRIERGE